MVVPDSYELQDLESNFSEVAVALFAAGTVQGTLQLIVDLAERAVDGCGAAGILVDDNGTVVTAAASSALVVVVDRLQIEAGEGPCLDASVEGSTFYASDLMDDPRWPTFGPSAVAAGIRSVLAYSLSENRPSALNLYARLPAAFGATDRAQGLLFATLARLALDSAEERAFEERRSLNLTEALRTRELIGQAQGILMERERITGDQAFEVLRRASQHMNVKLREVAQTLIETGRSPDTGTVSARPGTKSPEAPEIS
jgi:ANTAR domain/GAF domain